MNRTLPRLIQYLSVLAITATAAAQSIVSGPHITGLGHTSAQIVIATSGAISSASIEYGPTTSYGFSTAMAVNSNPSVTVGYPAELLPGTTYNYRIFLNGVNATGNRTFTTLPATDPIEEPVPPVLPVVGHEMPSGAYNPDITVATDCSNLKTILTSQIATLTGSNHQRLVLPVGAECAIQRYNFPARPNHTGWVVVQSSAVGTDAFPPDGVRFTPNWAGTTAKFSNTLIRVGGRTSAAAVVGSCGTDTNGGNDGFWFLTSAPSGSLPILRCSNAYPAYTGATTVTNATGSSPITLTISGHGFQRGDLVQVPVNSYGSNTTATKYLVSAVTSNTVTLWNYSKKTNGSFTTSFSVTPISDWKQPAFTQGTQNPTGACTEDTFYVNTSASTSWWCVDPTGNDFSSTVGTWRRLNYPDSVSSLGAAAVIAIDPEASRYRFVGIEMEAAAVPNPPPAGWFLGHNGFNRQGAVLAMVDMQGSQIVFDRCWVHAKGGAVPPIRLARGFIVEGGKDLAILNSYIDDIALWQGPTTAYSNFEGSTSISHYSGSPMLIENNFLGGAPTIHYYSENDSGDLPHDLTFRRNQMIRRQDLRRGSPENLARWTGIMAGIKSVTRNHWEWKHGERALIEGNRFSDGWTTLTMGQFLTITARRNTMSEWSNEAAVSIVNGVVTMKVPTTIRTRDTVLISGTGSAFDGLWDVQVGCDWYRCTTIKLAGAPEGSAGSGSVRHVLGGGRTITDVEARWNLMERGPEVIRILSRDAPSAGSVVIPFVRRIAVRQNLIVDLNSRRYTLGGYHASDGSFAGGNDGGVRYAYPMGTVEHLILEHNTVYSSTGTMPRFALTDATNYGLRISNELYSMPSTDSTATFIDGGDNKFGVSGLNNGWHKWESKNNVICCGHLSRAASYPSTWKWPSSPADFGFRRPAAIAPYDFRLRYDSRYSSGFKSSDFCQLTPTACMRATDDSDLGVDIDTLESKLGKVSNVRVRQLTSTGAIVSYLAPDQASCVLEHSSSPRWGTGTRVSDGGGERARNVRIDVSAYSAQSAIHARVLCAVEQPVVTFHKP